MRTIEPVVAGMQVADGLQRLFAEVDLLPAQGGS